MTKTLLRVKDLSVSFGKTIAVNKLSFNLAPGESIGIVGESGSGKSVSSLAIMGLLDQHAKIEGSAHFLRPSGKEEELLGLKERAKQGFRGKEIAMIFQEPMTSLNPVYTCGNQVIEAILKHEGVGKKEAKQRCLQLFEKVLLPDPERIYNAYPHELSGGQKQRVMIAMAISCKPKLLIADEPTTALDVTVQKEILSLLKDLQQEYGMAMIFISHDLAVVRQLCKRMLVMYRGDLVEHGNSENLFQAAEHPYTRGLLACRPPIGKYYKRLPTVADFTERAQQEPESLLKHLEATKPSFDFDQRPLMEVKNLNCFYIAEKNFWGKPTAFVKAVNNVSFDVYPGETLGLVGESGCGKSSLGRTLLRLQSSNGGEVKYKGENLLSLGARDMRKMRKDLQFIFQDPYSSLNPRMKIGEAILEPILYHQIAKGKEAKSQVFDLLEKVGLEAAHYDRYPHEFSGGQRQRIGIARALAVKPSFIICDESVSALDVSVQAQVLNLLNDLKKEFGLTYIFISHDLSVVKYMSDRIIVMNKGRIEEVGLPSEIYEHPKSEYTKKLINAIPD